MGTVLCFAFLYGGEGVEGTFLHGEAGSAWRDGSGAPFSVLLGLSTDRKRSGTPAELAHGVSLSKCPFTGSAPRV